MHPHRLRLHSERYGRSGNIGDNLRKLLGSPALDPLQTVIREAVQNVLDAAKTGQPPEVLIRIRRLTDSQSDVLRREVVAELPQHESSKQKIRGTALSRNPLVMEICDFGTSGLGGPTRSDRIPKDTQSTDFIDFLRNIGSSRDTQYGGGTYGFGKVSLYRMSSCNTILVDTFVHNETETQRRFMGCHIGGSYQLENGDMLQRFTGRHWWGALSPESDFVDPLVNDPAKAVADALGFPNRGPDRSGTSIMILGFDADNGSTAKPLKETGTEVVETLLWNFWPRMMESTETRRRLSCRVEVEGHELRVPNPESFPPLNLFTKAMDNIRSGVKAEIKSIRCLRPKAELGQLSTAMGLRASRHTPIESDSLIPAQSAHIAIMRPAEMVVRYIEGDPFSDSKVEWAGVFIASKDEEIEQAFADSEPPAHDDWVPNHLPKGRSRTFVNVALRELNREARSNGGRGTSLAVQEEQGPSLAKVAGLMGSLLEKGTEEADTRSKPGNRRSKSVPRKAKATKAVFTRLQSGYESYRGSVAIFRAHITQDAERRGLAIVAMPYLALDDQKAPPDQSPSMRPRVIAIQLKDETHQLKSEGTRLELDGRSGEIEVAVAMPPDCAVALDLVVERGAGA